MRSDAVQRSRPAAIGRLRASSVARLDPLAARVRRVMGNDVSFEIMRVSSFLITDNHV
jgi:hypothetical protein